MTPAGEEANHAAAPWVALAALRHAGAGRGTVALPVALLHHAAAQVPRTASFTSRRSRRGPGPTTSARNVALNCTAPRGGAPSEVSREVFNSSARCRALMYARVEPRPKYQQRLHKTAPRGPAGAGGEVRSSAPCFQGGAPLYSFLSSISTLKYDTHFFTPSENLTSITLWPSISFSLMMNSCDKGRPTEVRPLCEGGSGEEREEWGRRGEGPLMSNLMPVPIGTSLIDCSMLAFMSVELRKKISLFSPLP